MTIRDSVSMWLSRQAMLHNRSPDFVKFNANHLYAWWTRKTRDMDGWQVSGIGVNPAVWRRGVIP